MTTFDFGLGPVPAHQHPNGGGWVADSAMVSSTAYVGPDARIYGNALVYDNAHVYDNARVSGGGWESSPFHARVGRWHITHSAPNTVQIGCTSLALDRAFEREDALIRAGRPTAEELIMLRSVVLGLMAIDVKIFGSKSDGAP